MKLKYKAVLYNFIGFAFLYVLMRVGLGYVLKMNSLFLSISAAVIASILAPKFAVVKEQKLVMKWIFMKGFKEL